MGERTSYTPGTFSWAELVTSDPAAAKGFYTQVFGWDYDDQPTGPDGPPYSMALRDGHHVAALFGDTISRRTGTATSRSRRPPAPRRRPGTTAATSSPRRST